MANWIDSGYLENTDNIAGCPQNFLTTFMVLKEQGEHLKARLVVNGARKSKGDSLNDFLEPGGNVMLDLSELLLRLWRYKYVVCCDLANMFLNIKVSSADHPFNFTHFTAVTVPAKKDRKEELFLKCDKGTVT